MGLLLPRFAHWVNYVRKQSYDVGRSDKLYPLFMGTHPSKKKSRNDVSRYGSTVSFR